MSPWWLLLIVPATAIGAVVGAIIVLKVLFTMFFRGGPFR